LFPDDDPLWVETCIMLSCNITISGRTLCTFLVEHCEFVINSAWSEQHKVHDLYCGVLLFCSNTGKYSHVFKLKLGDDPDWHKAMAFTAL